MVYAEDQSINGTTLLREVQDENGDSWNQTCVLKKSLGPVLLRHGDSLYFSDDTYLRYTETEPHKESKLDFVMNLEIQVGAEQRCVV